MNHTVQWRTRRDSSGRKWYPATVKVENGGGSFTIEWDAWVGARSRKESVKGAEELMHESDGGSTDAMNNELEAQEHLQHGVIVSCLATKY